MRNKTIHIIISRTDKELLTAGEWRSGPPGLSLLTQALVDRLTEKDRSISEKNDIETGTVLWKCRIVSDIGRGRVQQLDGQTVNSRFEECPTVSCRVGECSRVRHRMG